MGLGRKRCLKEWCVWKKGPKDVWRKEELKGRWWSQDGEEWPEVVPNREAGGSHPQTTDGAQGKGKG